MPEQQMERLEGKVCVITGAGSGIGRATAIRFANEGAWVAAVDRDADAARNVEKELQAMGLRGSAWIADLSDAHQAESIIQEISRQFSGLGVLVNNAAISSSRSFDEMTSKEWHEVLNTNLMAYFVCARTAARVMRKTGGGSIVNISSVQRRVSEPGSGAYAVSKAGVDQLTRNLAIELAPADIVVNSISPGFIRTPMSIVNGVDETTTTSFRTFYIESGRIPLRRAGLPEEVAAAALFLASRECGYLTGADLIVDGGLTITI